MKRYFLFSTLALTVFTAFLTVPDAAVSAWQCTCTYLNPGGGPCGGVSYYWNQTNSCAGPGDTCSCPSIMCGINGVGGPCTY